MRLVTIADTYDRWSLRTWHWAAVAVLQILSNNNMVPTPVAWAHLAVLHTRATVVTRKLSRQLLGARFGAALGPPHMAAYQLRRCAQELADAERAALLHGVRPAALPDAQALDPAAEPARCQAAPAAPGGAAAALPDGSDRTRSSKRRRLADGPEAGGAGDGDGSPFAGGSDLRPAEAGSWESGEGGGADGGSDESCGGGNRRRRLAVAGSRESEGYEHTGGGEGSLSARENRAVALLALAASDAPTQSAAVPAAAPSGAAGDACNPDAWEACRRGPVGAHPRAASPARGPAHVPAGARVGGASGCDAGSGLGLGLTADATRVLAALSPAAVRRVLGALAGRFPRSTAALLGGALPPAAAELLVARLEAADGELAAAGAHI